MARLGLTILGSGSDGNALVVHTDHGALLFDAGFSGRELQKRLAEAAVDESLIRAILVSHEHSDHVKGLGPLARRFGVPVFANRLTSEAVRDKGRAPDQWHLFATGNAFEVAGFRISPFSIPHDAIDPVAFTVEFEGFKLGIATDLGHAGHLTCHQLRDCDALVLESNHDVEMLRNSGRPWPLKQRIMSRHGHLSNDDSMALVRKVVADRTRYLVLAHGSQECNRYEIMDRCASTCLADLGRTDIALLVARQDAHLPTAWL